MTYLIVGASSGLGKDLAHEFASKNRDIILISRDITDLEYLKKDIILKHKVDVKIFQVDLSSSDEVENFLKLNHNILGDLDGLLFPIALMNNEDSVIISNQSSKKILYSNFLSITIFIKEIINLNKNKKKVTIIGFGSISASIGRHVNTFYSSAKKALETYFESLIITTLNQNINVQFYTLGYLDTSLSFEKKLLLPKGSTKKLAHLVFSNLDVNGGKFFFPFWWKLINLIINILPFSIVKFIIKKFN